MPTFYSPKKLRKDGSKVLAAWARRPEVELGDLSRTVMEQDLKAYEAVMRSLIAHRILAIKLQRQRDELSRKIAGNCTRFRNGMRALFGSDSIEYGLSGGVRSSQRKKRTATKVSEVSAIDPSANPKLKKRRKSAET